MMTTETVSADPASPDPASPDPASPETRVLRQRYNRAQDGFDEVVASLPPEDWDGPSACTEWTRRDVLGHIVWGQRLVQHLATGLPFTDRTGAPGATNPGSLVAADPLGAWRAAREAADAELTEHALARIVNLSAFGGQVPLSKFVTALVTDFLAHTWDIGSTTAQGVQLDAEAVAASDAWSRDNIRSRRPGGIGPELAPPPGADAQARLLAFLGRS